MRTTILRLAALAAGVVLLASCDTRLASEPSLSGLPSTASGAKGPAISIDTPSTGALINPGDSVLVAVHLHSEKTLKTASMTAVTQKGSVDLGTFTETQRYK